MIGAETFCTELRDRGVSLVSGVPCGWLQGPLALMAEEPGYYVPAANEGAALAVAAGAELGGSRSAVLVQNSGLGNLVNPLTSLVGTFAIPVLVFMTLRGRPGPLDDEPQHAVTGQITEPLLDKLGIGHRVLGPDPPDLREALDEADLARADDQPFFVLVPRGIIGRVPVAGPPELPNPFDRAAAVEALLPWLDGAAVFTTTGRTSRELFALADRPGHFYMLGSMGHALALGLGTALARPDRRVVVLDGDGALLMHLGTAVTVAAAAPPNLVHVLLDNRSYDSTGGQSVPAPREWSAIGAAAGYRRVHTVLSAGEIPKVMAGVTEEPGPHLVTLSIDRSGRKPAGHPLDAGTPIELRRRFSEALRGSSARPG